MEVESATIKTELNFILRRDLRATSSDMASTSGPSGFNVPQLARNIALPNRSIVPSSAARTLANKPQQPDQTTESILLYLEELKGAADVWVKQKGGEERLGDANRSLLRTLKLVVHGMEMSLRLNKANQVNDNTRIQDRLTQIESALERDQDRRLSAMQYDIQDEMYEAAQEVVGDLLECSAYHEDFVDTLKERVRLDPDLLLDDDMMDVKKFVLAQMKAEKDGPETALDRLNEHVIELD